jgi:hypothetical protein
MRPQGAFSVLSSLSRDEPDQVFQAVVQTMIPLKRPQTLRISGMLSLLASEEAKEITGQAINVDGALSSANWRTEGQWSISIDQLSVIYRY